MAWSFAGTFGRLISRFFGIAILARFVGPEAAGIWAAVVIVLTPIFDLISTGIVAALVRQDDFPDRDAREVLSFTALLGLASAALLILLSPLAIDVFRLETNVNLFLLGGITLFSKCANITATVQLTRELAFRKLAMMGSAGTVVGFWGTCLPMAIAGWNEWALGAGVAGEAIATMFVGWYFVPTRPGLPGSNLRKYLKDSVGFSSHGVMSSIARQVDNYSVAIFLQPAALGVYTKAFALMELPTRLISVTSNRVLLPAFSKRKARPDIIQVNFLKLLQVYALLASPLAICVALYAHELIAILLGAKWIEVAVPLQILSLALFLRVLIPLPITLLKSKGVSFKLAGFQAVYGVTVLVLCLVFVPFGLAGIAVAADFGVLALFVILYSSASRILEISFFKPILLTLPSLLAAAFVGLCSFSFHVSLQAAGVPKSASALSSVALFCLVYLAVVLQFRRRLLPEEVCEIVDKRLPGLSMRREVA